MTAPRPSARRPRRPASRPKAEAPRDAPPPARCSGVVHYFALGPETWPAVLAAARSLGVGAIDVPVPWSVHEVAERRYDFGDSEPSRNLGGFLALAHDAGLRVLLRPGPLVDPEIDRSGLPARVTGDARFVACDEGRRPLLSFAPPRMFAVPSLASRAFREEAAHWLAAVCGAVEPYCAPGGPVESIELDVALPFLAPDAPWNADHHPDARASRDEAAREALAEWKRVVTRAAPKLAVSTRASVRDPRRAGTRVEIGAPPWRAPRTDAETVAELARACTRAERGVCLHVLADTGRWLGAPIDARGRVRPVGDAVRRVLEALEPAPC